MRTILTLAATLILCGFFSMSAASSSPGPPMAGMQNAQNMPNMQSRNMVNPDSAPASPVSGIEWSIFNHRGAAWFIFLWGLTAFIAGLRWPRRTWLSFASPIMLLGLVEFLFLRNDPKTWPIGPIGFWISFQDPAVFQHRVFVLLILAIAIVELLRAADRLPPLLYKFALPSLALFGGIYLFFHKHGGLEMQHMVQQASDPVMAASPGWKGMLATMALIKHEHVWFSLFGFGLAGAKLLADTGVLKGRLGATLWPVFAMALGVYMFGYTE